MTTHGGQRSKATLLRHWKRSTPDSTLLPCTTGPSTAFLAVSCAWLFTCFNVLTPNPLNTFEQGMRIL